MDLVKAGLVAACLSGVSACDAFTEFQAGKYLGVDVVRSDVWITSASGRDFYVQDSYGTDPDDPSKEVLVRRVITVNGRKIPCTDELDCIRKAEQALREADRDEHY